MKGKLVPRKYRRSRSSSSSSKESRSSDSSSSSSTSSNDSSKRSKKKRQKGRSRFSLSPEKKSQRRSHSSSSSNSSPGRSQKYRRTDKRHKSYKTDNVYSRINVKDEPLSEDDNRRRSRYSPTSSRRPEHDSRRNSKFNKVPIKKERWGSTQDKEPEWGKKSDRNNEEEKVKKPQVDKAKPDFGLSGKLTEETNMYNGVVIKYSEPPEARKPKRRWRLYPFKGDQSMPTLFIHRQSAYLIGRDRKVADLPVDHPSCSKQHAALQYRLVPFKREDGMSGKRICPYIIDLESANGTFVNNKKIEPKKYVELMERDVIKFGFSSREYVLLHEHSKDGDDDDNM